MKTTLQKLGKSLSAMVMPNIGAFIAWGFITALFIADELEAFDVLLGHLLSVIDSDTLLIITADHGNDPTFKGTDHTRECVPCLMYSPSMKEHGMLSDSSSFGVLGATVLDNFNLFKPVDLIGESLLEYIR